MSTGCLAFVTFKGLALYRGKQLSECPRKMANNELCKMTNFYVTEKMNLCEFITVIFSIEQTINWLKTKNLLMLMIFLHHLLILRSFTLSKFVILHLFVLEFYLFFTSSLHEFYLFHFCKHLCNITQ